MRLTLNCPWKKPSMAFFHLAGRWKRRGFPRPACLASCSGRRVPQSVSTIPRRWLAALIAGICLVAIGQAAPAQNDWQFPDPYFGAFQHRQAGTPQAERRYRQEIAPQQPHRLHEHRPPPAQVRPRPRWVRHRAGT
jgi:hypothetical protein